MEFEPPLTNSQTWQDALDPRLVGRLLRPLVQPGVIDSRLAKSIVARIERMTNRLPLLVHLVQRQAGGSEAFQANPIPIAYAQPSPIVADSVHQSPHSSVAQTEKPTVIQAKFADSVPSSDSLTHLSSLPDLPFPPEARSHPNSSTTPQTQPPMAHVPPLPLKQDTNAIQASSSSAPQADIIHSPTINPIVVQAQWIRSTLPGATDLSGTRSPLPPESNANIQRPDQPTTGYAQSIEKNANYESQVQRLNQSMISGWSNASGELRSPSVSPAVSRPVIRVSNGANPSSQFSGLEMVRQPLVFSSSAPAIAPQRGTDRRARGYPKGGMESRWNTPEAKGPREIGSLDTAPAAGTQSTITAQTYTAQTYEPLKAVETTQPPVDLEALASKVERKLMRRLVVESERRGQGRWR